LLLLLHDNNDIQLVESWLDFQFMLNNLLYLLLNNLMFIYDIFDIYDVHSFVFSIPLFMLSRSIYYTFVLYSWIFI